MISIALIERSLDQQDHDRLLRDLAGNGLTLPLPLRMQLCDSSTAVRGLALRRLVELTYGPTARSRELTLQLIQAVHGFADEADPTAADPASLPDVLTLAAALAALAQVESDQPAAIDEHLTRALELGLRRLAGQQDCDGLFTGPRDRSLGDRALTTAFILSLVGSCPRFTQQLRLPELYGWFDQRDGRLDRHTQQLWDLACIGLQGSADPAALTHPESQPGLAA